MHLIAAVGSFDSDNFEQLLKRSWKAKFKISTNFDISNT